MIRASKTRNKIFFSPVHAAPSLTHITTALSLPSQRRRSPGLRLVARGVRAHNPRNHQKSFDHTRRFLHHQGCDETKAILRHRAWPHGSRTRRAEAQRRRITHLSTAALAQADHASRLTPHTLCANLHQVALTCARLRLFLLNYP